MKIEAGKKYVNRKGEIVGPMEYNNRDNCDHDPRLFPRCFDRIGYRPDGGYLNNEIAPDAPHLLDLISEYKELRLKDGGTYLGSDGKTYGPVRENNPDKTAPGGVIYDMPSNNHLWFRDGAPYRVGIDIPTLISEAPQQTEAEKLALELAEAKIARDEANAKAEAQIRGLEFRLAEAKKPKMVIPKHGDIGTLVASGEKRIFLRNGGKIAAYDASGDMVTLDAPMLVQNSINAPYTITGNIFTDNFFRA